MRHAAAAVLTSALALGACGKWTGESLGQAPTPAPITVPAQFSTANPDQRVAPADTLIGGGCLNPLVDPATGTRITLIRSGSGIGDYEAPSGAFGIPDGKVIRIDCNTGQVAGLVRR